LAKKLNIEEIKLLLPDYITGSLIEEDTAMVDEAIKSTPGLATLYTDMKSALEFVESVKFEEPVPQYWNNLLPKIHEKIETRNEKKLFKNPIPFIWKILVPVAAIILIAVIYRIATSPENQITKDNQQNIMKENQVEPRQQKQLAEEKKTTDTVIKTEKNNNNIKNEKRHPLPIYQKEIKEPENNENLAKHENEPEQKESEQKEHDFLAELSSDDINDLSEINSVEANSTEDELDNEIQNLNNSEKEALIQELENSNL